MAYPVSVEQQTQLVDALLYRQSSTEPIGPTEYRRRIDRAYDDGFCAGMEFAIEALTGSCDAWEGILTAVDAQGMRSDGS